MKKLIEAALATVEIRIREFRYGLDNMIIAENMRARLLCVVHSHEKVGIIIDYATRRAQTAEYTIIDTLRREYIEVLKNGFDRERYRG